MKMSATMSVGDRVRLEAHGLESDEEMAFELAPRSLALSPYSLPPSIWSPTAAQVSAPSAPAAGAP